MHVWLPPTTDFDDASGNESRNARASAAAAAAPGTSTDVPDGTVIGYDAEADHKRYAVSTTGIVVVEHGHRWT